jgi:hypothetical protein
VSEALFYCNAALFDINQTPEGKATRSDIRVDGLDAYAPYAAYLLESAVKHALEGAPAVEETHTFNPATGEFTIKELDPISRCAPGGAFPPTATSCERFVPSGVSLERSWRMQAAGRVVAMTDVWRSSDGAGHAVDVLYDQYFRGAGSHGAFQLPGAAGFAATATGQSLSLPSGPGALLYSEEEATPEGGDLVHPFGAAIYDAAPDGPAVVFRGSNMPSFNGIAMPYLRTLPAGGSRVLRMVFVTSYGAAEARALAAQAVAGFHPSVTISSPAGPAVTEPTATVTGTASDSGQLASLTVRGQPVPVSAGGAWSANVPLSIGANTLTATATDQAGLSASASITILYTPAPAHASRVGHLTVHGRHVSFVLACSGPAGSSCTLRATLTTTEWLRGRHVRALSARHRPRNRIVTVASTRLTIAAGARRTVTLSVNSAGRRLLARFHRLPLQLLVQLLDPTGHATGVFTQKLAIASPRARRGHH